VTQSTTVYRRRRVAAIVALAVAAALVVFAITQLTGSKAAEQAENGAGAKTAQATPAPRKPAELPRGGRTILPDFRVVAYYGAPQDKELGALGIGSPAHAARRLERAAKPFARKTRPVLPAMELLAVVAAASPGPGERYNMRQSDSVIRRYLKAARKAKTLLILDIQPGRSDFFTETKRLRKWLKEPDVGLALDPEWRMGPHEVPARVVGSVRAREVNHTSRWLSRLVERKGLPQKLFVLHQFRTAMIERIGQIKARPGLAMVQHVDGFGTPGQKLATFHAVARPRQFKLGFKLFYDEDVHRMRPAQVLAIRPRVSFVSFQ